MKCQCCNSEMNKTKNAHKCNGCGHFYLSYNGDLEKFYENYRKHSPLFSIEQRKKYIDSILYTIGDYINNDWHIVEYGCGDGLLLKTIKEDFETRNLELTGVDFDKDMVRKVREFNIKCSKGDASIYCIKCDCCMAFDVLEHINDINNALYNWSKHSSYMIVQVPANRRPKFEFKGHFHVFSETSFKTLLSKYGKIEYFITGKSEQFSKGPAHLAIVKVSDENSTTSII